MTYLLSITKESQLRDFNNIHNNKTLFVKNFFLPMSKLFNWPTNNCDFNQLTNSKNQQQRTSL